MHASVNEIGKVTSCIILKLMKLQTVENRSSKHNYVSNIPFSTYVLCGVFYH